MVNLARNITVAYVVWMLVFSLKLGLALGFGFLILSLR
jgi:hypothetical protein